MVHLALIDQGIVTEARAREARSGLQDVSLAELVEAAQMVREDPGESLPNGGRRVSLKVDDRVIAAIYTGLHYRPTPASEAESVVCLGGGLGVFVINNVPEVCDD